MVGCESRARFVHFFFLLFCCALNVPQPTPVENNIRRHKIHNRHVMQKFRKHIVSRRHCVVQYLLFVSAHFLRPCFVFGERAIRSTQKTNRVNECKMQTTRAKKEHGFTWNRVRRMQECSRPFGERSCRSEKLKELFWLRCGELVFGVWVADVCDARAADINFLNSERNQQRVSDGLVPRKISVTQCITTTRHNNKCSNLILYGVHRFRDELRALSASYSICWEPTQWKAFADETKLDSLSAVDRASECLAPRPIFVVKYSATSPHRKTALALDGVFEIRFKCEDI